MMSLGIHTIRGYRALNVGPFSVSFHVTSVIFPQHMFFCILFYRSELLYLFCSFGRHHRSATRFMILLATFQCLAYLKHLPERYLSFRERPDVNTRPWWLNMTKMFKKSANTSTWLSMLLSYNRKRCTRVCWHDWWCHHERCRWWRWWRWWTSSSCRRRWHYNSDHCFSL